MSYFPTLSFQIPVIFLPAIFLSPIRTVGTLAASNAFNALTVTACIGAQITLVPAPGCSSRKTLFAKSDNRSASAGAFRCVVNVISKACRQQQRGDAHKKSDGALDPA